MYDYDMISGDDTWWGNLINAGAKSEIQLYENTTSSKTLEIISKY